ncbi:MAG TPA: LysR substrate-binding domain-containing protein [Burkholderiales bacterium]|nr:LysR substrate-binding domain-containing protein [Burkholderiales bacterium]
MDIKQLDYFVHVADLGSFTKAASLLSVAQSALSHQVRQLEVEVQQTLLYRNGRGVTPTDAGRRLLVHARGIVMQVRRARDELTGSRDAAVGHVVLGLPPTLARVLSVPLFKSLRKSFPGGTFSMMEGLSASILEWLVEGRVDIGLVHNPTPLPSIEIAPLRDVEMFLISPRTAGKGQRPRPVPLRDLPRYPLILPSRPNANRMRIEAQLAYLGLKPQIAFEIDGVTSILGLIREGYGHTVLPLTSLRGQNLGRDFVKSRVQPTLTIQLSVVTSAQRPTTPLAKAALALVHKTAMRVLFGERSRLPGVSGR